MLHKKMPLIIAAVILLLLGNGLSASITINTPNGSGSPDVGNNRNFIGHGDYGYYDTRYYNGSNYVWGSQNGTFNYDATTGDTVTVTGGASISGTHNMRGGNNTLNIDNGNIQGTYSMGDGNSVFNMTSGTVNGTTTFNMGAGQNSFSISGGNVSNALTVNGGTGVDIITINGSTVISAAFTASTGGGADIINVQNGTISGNLNVSMGDGNDQFNLSGGTLSGTTKILDMGTGNDTVTLSGGSITGDIAITMGSQGNKSISNSINLSGTIDMGAAGSGNNSTFTNHNGTVSSSITLRDHDGQNIVNWNGGDFSGTFILEVASTNTFNWNSGILGANSFTDNGGIHVLNLKGGTITGDQTFGNLSRVQLNVDGIIFDSNMDLGGNDNEINLGYSIYSNTSSITSGAGSDHYTINAIDSVTSALADVNTDIIVNGGSNQFDIQNGNIYGDITTTGSGSQYNPIPGPGQNLDSTGGGNTFIMTGGNFIGSTITIGGTENIDSFAMSNGSFDAGSEIYVNSDGDSTFGFEMTGGTFSGKLYVNITDPYGTPVIANDTQSTMTISGNSLFSGSANIAGHDNTILIDLNTSTVMDGSIDLSNAASTTNNWNQVTINNGDLSNAYIHGSDIGETRFIVNGGTIGSIYGGDGENTFLMYGGETKNLYGSHNENSTFEIHPDAIVHNIYGNGEPDPLSPGDREDVYTHTNNVIIYGGERTMNNVLNITDLVLSSGTYNGQEYTTHLTIGSINPGDLHPIASSEAQITAERVFVSGGSSLYIHSSDVNYQQDYHQVGDNSGLANVINKLEIEGTVNINEATIQGIDANGDQAAAAVTVYGGGTLHGYTLDADGRPNVVGDVTIKTGGTIRPYDPTIFAGLTNLNNRPKGVAFVISEIANGGAGGTVSFEAGSILSTRLFAQANGDNEKVQDNQTGEIVPVDLFYSDWVKAVTADLSQVGTGSQAGKVQYNPVFGFNYEWDAKVAFERYSGPGDQSYYFSVLETDNPIAQLSGDVDANDYFNRYIVKSDMLGEWYFLKNEDADSVILRFRLLASHPKNGGLAADLNEPNAIAVTKVIDNIRYPFATDFNQGMGFVDEVPQWYKDETGYDGYSGDMVEYYSLAAIHEPGRYDNYRETWVQDFEDLLGGIQLAIQNGDDLNQAFRQLHPEPYASMSSFNLTMMDQFIGNRERNSVSALFQVEADQYAMAARQAEGMPGYASLADWCASPFVKNPVRFWASGFGATGKQKKYGTEYGYDTDVWGGSIGAIKEYGDLYLGLTGGYARADMEWDALNAKLKSDSHMAEALIGLRCGMGFLEIHGNYAYNKQKMTRDINIATYSGTANGDYNDHIYGGGVRWGYQYLMGNNWLFIPTIGFNYMKTKNRNFEETGRQNMATLLRFRSGDISRQVYKAPITVRLNRAFPICGFVLTPEVRASFTPVFGDKVSKATAEFVGNPISGQYFTAVGVDTGRYIGSLGATIELSRRGRFFIAANYDYTFQRKAHYHNYSLQVGYNF